MSTKKSATRLILVLYFIPFFSLAAYLRDWGNWKQDKHSEVAHMEKLESEDRAFVLPGGQEIREFRT